MSACGSISSTFYCLATRSLFLNICWNPAAWLYGWLVVWFTILSWKELIRLLQCHNKLMDSHRFSCTRSCAACVVRAWWHGWPMLTRPLSQCIKTHGPDEKTWTLHFLSDSLRNHVSSEDSSWVLIGSLTLCQRRHAVHTSTQIKPTCWRC